MPSLFFLKDNSHYSKVEIADILYLKAMENYTQIVTVHRTYTILIRLATIELQLPPSVFLRANRSHLVNASKISAVSKSELIINDYQISLTRTYSDAIINGFVNDYLIRKDV